MAAEQQKGREEHAGVVGCVEKRQFLVHARLELELEAGLGGGGLLEACLGGVAQPFFKPAGGRGGSGQTEWFRRDYVVGA